MLLYDTLWHRQPSLKTLHVCVWVHRGQNLHHWDETRPSNLPRPARQQSPTSRQLRLTLEDALHWSAPRGGTSARQNQLPLNTIEKRTAWATWSLLIIISVVDLNKAPVLSASLLGSWHSSPVWASLQHGVRWRWALLPAFIPCTTGSDGDSTAAAPVPIQLRHTAWVEAM